MTDQDIILLLRQGQIQKGLDVIYTNYPAIERLIVNNGGTSDDAQDIFQESLLVFIQKTEDESFQLTSSIGTYLYSVCRFMWYQKLRSKKYRTDVQAEDLNIPAHIEFDILEHQNEEKKHNALDSILEALGSVCKQILSFYYLDKLSMKEIALKLEYKSDKIAKNQKYKCLERAKNLVKTDHEFSKLMQL